MDTQERPPSQGEQFRLNALAADVTEHGHKLQQALERQQDYADELADKGVDAAPIGLGLRVELEHVLADQGHTVQTPVDADCRLVFATAALFRQYRNAFETGPMEIHEMRLGSALNRWWEVESAGGPCQCAECTSQNAKDAVEEFVTYLRERCTRPNHKEPMTKFQIACHELAHAYAAVRCGVPVTEVNLKGFTTLEHGDIRSRDDGMISVAGAAVKALLRGDEKEGITRGQDDFDMHRAHLRSQANGSRLSEDEFRSRAWSDAVKLLRPVMPMLRSAAKELVRLKSIDGLRLRTLFLSPAAVEPKPKPKRAAKRKTVPPDLRGKKLLAQYRSEVSTPASEQ